VYAVHAQKKHKKAIFNFSSSCRYHPSSKLADHFQTIPITNIIITDLFFKQKARITFASGVQRHELAGAALHTRASAAESHLHA